MINRFYFLIGKEISIYIFILLLTLIVSTVLELIGIGLIPVFISFISDQNLLLSKLPNNISEKISFINNMEKIELIFLFSILFFLFYLLKNLILIVIGIIESAIIYKTKIFHTKKLYDYYLNLPILFHANTNPSKLIRNIRVGISHVSFLIVNAAIILKEFIFLTILLIFLLFVDVKVTLFSILVLGITLIIYLKVIKSKIQQIGNIENSKNSRLIQLINQSLGSIRDTKILGIKKYLFNQYINNLKSFEKSGFYNRILNNIPRLLLEQTAITLVLSICIYLYLIEIPEKEILPILSLFAIAAIRMIPSLNRISLSITGYKYRKPSIDIIYNEYRKIEKFKIEKFFEKQIQFKKKLILKNISFKYPKRKKFTLNKINLSLQKGKMISIIGKSGSGKTTLISIILGLLKPSEGKIIIDGREVSLFNKYWYKKIGYVAQDIYLIDDTIKNNIIFGREVKNNQLKKIKSLINFLSLDNMTKSLKYGLNTKVGDRGVRVSGGERQRIGIARAIFHNPEIIILDEATASLDIKIEEKIIKKIKQKFKDSTILSVSHRKIPINYSDEIFELRNNKLYKIKKNK